MPKLCVTKDKQRKKNSTKGVAYMMIYVVKYVHEQCDSFLKKISMNKFTNYVQTQRHWLARATALPTSVSKHTELDTLHARLRNITATSTETTHMQPSTRKGSWSWLKPNTHVHTWGTFECKYFAKACSNLVCNDWGLSFKVTSLRSVLEGYCGKFRMHKKPRYFYCAEEKVSHQITHLRKTQRHRERWFAKIGVYGDKITETLLLPFKRHSRLGRHYLRD